MFKLNEQTGEITEISGAAAEAALARFGYSEWAYRVARRSAKVFYVGDAYLSSLKSRLEERGENSMS